VITQISTSAQQIALDVLLKRSALTLWGALHATVHPGTREMGLPALVSDFKAVFAMLNNLSQ